MIYVTGDTHGDYKIFSQKKFKNIKVGDTLIICGDFGFIWNGDSKEKKVLDKLAKNGNADAYKFPHPRIDGSPLDFSFSGLKTSVINIIHNASQKGENICIEDLGASYISAVVNCLTENLIKAAEITGHKKIVVAGGVSANSVLRRELESLCKKNYLELYMPELSLCGDNAAMVGSQAYYEYKAGHIAKENLNAIASLGIDKNPE